VTKIAGSTVEEFLKNAGKKFGGDGMGYCEAKTRYEGAQKKAIAEIAKLAKEHELNHKASYENAFEAWKPKKNAQELMDQTFKSDAEAKKAISEKLKDLDSKLKSACLALHKKEGFVDAIPQKDGTYKVSKSPEGAGGCS
jgi:hypothetical protein